MGIQTDIHASLPNYPPSMKRVAEVVLEDPSAVLAWTISELAAAGRTSETSVIRFCRTLGFRGYPQFRLQLANELGTERGRGGHGRSHGADISPKDTTADVIAKVSGGLVHGIQETAATVDPEALAAVAEAVGRADRVVLYGVSASGAAAHDLQQKLLRIGRYAVSCHDAHDAMVAAAVLSAGDVAIGFSHSGQTKETVALLRVARREGATTVAVTNAASSTMAQEADYLLRTAVLETTFRSGAMASRTAQLAIVDYLFVLVAQKNYAETVEALAETYETVKVLRDDR